MGTALTIHQEHLTDNETRAYVIADNQLAELADLDDEPSTIELGEFSTLYLDHEFYSPSAMAANALMSLISSRLQTASARALDTLLPRIGVISSRDFV